MRTRDLILWVFIEERFSLTANLSISVSFGIFTSHLPRVSHLKVCLCVRANVIMRLLVRTCESFPFFSGAFVPRSLTHLRGGKTFFRDP
jgi:hypothetical protein